ncbi:hypothetical protein AQ484_05245 [Acinetobacter baumannii]|nr:hypothetical protein AQ484_05245 [Acinetobacter baumannii]
MLWLYLLSEFFFRLSKSCKHYPISAQLSKTIKLDKKIKNRKISIFQKLKLKNEINTFYLIWKKWMKIRTYWIVKTG